MHPKKQQIKKQLRIFWKEFEWPFILSLGSLAFCLGIIGFQRYHFLTGKSYLLVDSIYQSLQLFSMNSGSVEPISGSSLPWELQVSRFLAPAVTAYAFLQAVLFLFQDRYTSWKLRQMQSHIIICGLGRKGFLLAQEFSKTYASVVVIEIDKNNSQIESCAESGILVLIGDGRDPTLLNKIGVQKAKYLISVCGDDGTNAEIAESARQIIRKGTNSKLICIIHIINPQLWTLLRERELEVKDNSFTLEFFNVYNSGARVLIRNTSPIQNIDYSKNILPHLLIVGLGWFAESLLVQIAQLWCPIYKSINLKLPITIMEQEAERKIEDLRIRIPLLSQVCSFDFQSNAKNSPDFLKSNSLLGQLSKYPLSHIYVCHDDSSDSIIAALALLQKSMPKNIQILVLLNEESGLASLVQHIRQHEERPQINTFNLLGSACKPGLLDDGTHETLARVIHSSYFSESKIKDADSIKNPNLVEWDLLAEEVKESNRLQAFHIGIKLDQIGYGITPWVDFGAEDFYFSEEEIEIMAILEHERWFEEKTKSGWHFGIIRNEQNKLHPDLVDWNDPSLSEIAREKDRHTVRKIPNYLLQAGFQIYKLVSKDG